MNIRFLGAHNCDSQTTAFPTILIDGILALDAGGLTSGLSLEEQFKLKAVLLSHQHYDHIRDIPALGMSLYLNETSIDIYGAQPVYDILAAHLLSDELYVNFLENPPQSPIIRFHIIKPGCEENIAGYTVLPVAVNHSVPTTGYQVTSAEGNSLLYTSDTGFGLEECWRQVSPQVLIIDTSGPNRYEDFARKTGHLTPHLLLEELTAFRELKGYLPQIYTVHMCPNLMEEIEPEMADASASLGHPITLAQEGLEIEL